MRGKCTQHCKTWWATKEEYRPLSIGAGERSAYMASVMHLANPILEKATLTSCNSCIQCGIAEEQ